MATAVAMLCVLREDFFIEMHGIGTLDHVDHLDDNGSGFRRTYFWRNSLRTLEEIKKVLNLLNSYSEFRDAMAGLPELHQSFEDAKKALNVASEKFLSNLRNTVAGHLDKDTMQAGVNNLNPHAEGLAEFGRTAGTTHFKFATELVWSAVLPDSAPKTMVADLEALLTKSADLLTALEAIDSAIACYMRSRRLF